MLLVRGICHHEPVSIGQAHIIARFLRLLMLGAEVSIHNEGRHVSPSTMSCNQFMKGKARPAAYCWGWFSQPSGRLTPGRGHAGQAMARPPGPGAVQSSYPTPWNLRAFKLRHCRETRSKSRYRSYAKHQGPSACGELVNIPERSEEIIHLSTDGADCSSS